MPDFKWEQIKDEEIKWVGVDFDLTIAHSSGFPNFIPTVPLPGCVEALQELDRRGYKITVHTARHWADYQNIERWCAHYKIPVRRIICGKPLFKWMIDDKNLAFDPNDDKSWDNIVANFK